MKFDVSKLTTYPSDPGVYLMKGRAGSILYIGKAKNLKTRLKQYFVSGGDGRWIIPFLQEHVEEIETVVTLSEKEALLLENTLIKKYRPRFNALLKDDKAYTALKINIKHPWPMVSLIRYKGKLRKDALYFGPYTSAQDARQTVDLLQRLFPLRQCSDQELLRRTRPCILYGMKRCSAPCVGYIDPKQYSAYVEGATQFLRGDYDQVSGDLRQQMEQAAERLDFERAAELQQLMISIDNTLQVQRVDHPARGITGDVLGIFRQGDEVILSQLEFTQGKLHGYHHHSFTRILETDEELIESFLLQNYQDQDRIPQDIFLPIALENREVLEDILNHQQEKKLHLACPQRGEKRALLEMAFRNAETAFKQKKDEGSIRERTLLELQEKLRLIRYPKRIECVDTSHLSGQEAVSAVIAFMDGLPEKAFYRRYKLNQTLPGDDYGALKEVLVRRYQKTGEEHLLPDLLIIDGGKGHLNIARKILQELNIVSIDLIALAKEQGRHDKGVTQEQVFLPDAKDPLLLSPHSPVLFFLQRIRDEAHRFAINYQKKRRIQTTMVSELQQIPGIGPKKQKALLCHFGSVKQIREASQEVLSAVKILNSKDVEAVFQFFRSIPK